MIQMAPASGGVAEKRSADRRYAKFNKVASELRKSAPPVEFKTEIRGVLEESGQRAMIITRVLDLVCIYSHIEGLTKDKGAHY